MLRVRPKTGGNPGSFRTLTVREGLLGRTLRLRRIDRRRRYRIDAARRERVATYESADGKKAPGTDSVLTQGTDRIFTAGGMKLPSADEERANHPLVEADHTDGHKDERPVQSAVRSPGVGGGSFHGVSRRTTRGTAAPTAVSYTHDRPARRMSSADTNRHRNGNVLGVRYRCVGYRYEACVNAYHNHGRWVADCSTPYCTEAHLVEPGDVFTCGNCHTNHGAVAFPADKYLVDAALSRRIIPETRNWLPGETVDDLRAENAAHEGMVR